MLARLALQQPGSYQRNALAEGERREEPRLLLKNSYLQCSIQLWGLQFRKGHGPVRASSEQGCQGGLRDGTALLGRKG